jgi:hypothetical protein
MPLSELSQQLTLAIEIQYLRQTVKQTVDRLGAWPFESPFPLRKPLARIFCPAASLPNGIEIEKSGQLVGRERIKLVEHILVKPAQHCRYSRSFAAMPLRPKYRVA